MTNNVAITSRTLEGAGTLIRVYLAVAAATLVALAVLSALAPDQAGTDAWVHAAIVTAFAVLLPLRLRSAQRGRRSGLRAVGIIAGVLLLVNAVESGLDLFPVWMRVEMIAIAALMAGVVVLVSITAARHH